MDEVREGPFWDMVEGKIPPPPSAELLGWTLIEVNPGKGRSQIQFEAKREFLNAVGNIQSGFLAAMLEEAMRPALVCTLPSKHIAPTMELKTNFMRPAKMGTMFATGRVGFKAKDFGFVEGTLRDSDGKMIATASSTVRIVLPQPEEEST